MTRLRKYWSVFLLTSTNIFGQCHENSPSFSCSHYIRRRYRRFYMLNYSYCQKYLLIVFLFFLFSSYHLSFWTQNVHSSHVKSQPSTSIRILYAIRTSSQFYQTRLIYFLRTWIPLVQNDVYFISDTLLPNISSDHTLITKNSCGLETHSMNALCCKTAHDFIIYRRHLSDYNWFCHFDDDQYVNVRNLKKYLSTLDFNQPYYIGRASWSESLKRSKEPFPHPFWFATLGAGVCLSRQTVHLLGPYVNNISHFVDGCIIENYHDDIYLGFLLSGYLNISLTKNLRFHSHLEKSFYNHKQAFLRTFTDEITFGFKMPDRYPYFLPELYKSNADPYRIRTLHCLLNTQLDDCETKIRQHLFNSTM